MDIATLIGIIGAFSAIITAILMGGDMSIFVNPPGLMIVVGGTAFVTLMKFPIKHTLGAFGIALKAFFHKTHKPVDIIEQNIELANIARKEGLLGLEKVDVDNEFLRKGIQLVVDGNDPEFVHKMLSTDISLTIQRNETGLNIFKAIGDVAPAMGMIGTLIGLVQMMSNMDDPSTIGPAMAVALLTTFYGAVIANAIALPIADKLDHRNNEERLKRSMILEGINAIQEGLNPRMIEGLLSTYLPDNQKKVLDDRAA